MNTHLLMGYMDFMMNASDDFNVKLWKGFMIYIDIVVSVGNHGFEYIVAHYPPI